MSHDKIDLHKIQTYSLKDRPSKVSISDFSQVHQKGDSFADFLDRLPNILAAKNLKEVIHRVLEARRHKKPVIFGMGAHVIKVGLAPVVIDLMERNIITGVAFNGAAIVHDFELAYAGKTSEDVDQVIGSGQFGMAKETGEFLGEAIRYGAREVGLGRGVGEKILEAKLPHRDLSILATAARLNIPATIHVAVGTDIVHMHPAIDPECLGKASHTDFLKFADMVSELEGGIYFNIGSAVILPEVFLKAITLVRNLGFKCEKFTTVNCDFVHHYRPTVNVVTRPTAQGGEGLTLYGHHEILLPLLAAGIIEKESSRGEAEGPVRH